jgi:hypothetical protein
MIGYVLYRVFGGEDLEPAVVLRQGGAGMYLLEET